MKISCCLKTVVLQKNNSSTVYVKQASHNSSRSMPAAGPYCLVQVFGQDKQIEPVLDESNVPLAIETASLWVIHGVKVGYYRPAGILKTLPGLDKLEESHLHGKRIRQLNNGLFVLSDVAAAVLFGHPKIASQWALNPKHRSVASSLTFIDSGHLNVSLLPVDSKKFHLCVLLITTSLILRGS